MKKNYNSNRVAEIGNENDNQHKQKDRRVTRCSYIEYRISIKPNIFNAFFCL